MSDIMQWEVNTARLRALRAEALVNLNKPIFLQYVNEMDDPKDHQGLCETLVLAVGRNQRWAVEILLSNPQCSPNFKNALAIQEASKSKNSEMIEFLYHLCDVDLALTDMKMLDAPHLYETLENYDLKMRINKQLPAPRNNEKTPRKI